jgi:hypothetical protein
MAYARSVGEAARALPDGNRVVQAAVGVDGSHAVSRERADWIAASSSRTMPTMLPAATSTVAATHGKAEATSPAPCRTISKRSPRPPWKPRQAISDRLVLRYTAHPAGTRPAGPLPRRCDMHTARRLTAPALVILTLALAYLATATTAGARPAPPADGGGYVPPPTPPVIVNHTGSAVWTYLVVALAAAVLTLALAWMVERLRHAHSHAAHASAA